jgi:hypothetical protein
VHASFIAALHGVFADAQPTARILAENMTGDGGG